MLRVALIRGAVSGVVTGVAALARFIGEPPATSGNEDIVQPVIAVALISGTVTIIVALIYVVGPYLLKKRTEKDPAFRQTHDEATDALVSELVRKEREIQKLEQRNEQLERRAAQYGRRSTDHRGRDDTAS